MLVDNSVLDGALNVLKNNVVKITVCSTQQPTTYTQATNSTDYMLAESSALSSTQFTVADSTVDGRKITMPQLTDLTVVKAGNAQHIACVSASSIGTLYYVTTCSVMALTTSNLVTIPAWKIRIADPTSG